MKTASPFFMQITVECNHCGQAYSVDEKFIGRTVSCQACGQTFVMKLAAPPSAPSSDPFENAVFEKPKPPPQLPPTRWNSQIETSALDSVSVSAPKPAPSQARQTSQPLSYQPRRAMARVRDPWVDTTSIYIIFLFLALTVAYTIYLTVQIFQKVNDSKAAGSAALGLWETTIVSDILFFVLVAPMVLLAMFATSKIFNFKLGDIAYLRACAISALPFVFFYVASAFEGPLLILLALAAIPTSLFAIKKFFELEWVEWLAGTVFSIIGFSIGCFFFAIIVSVLVVAGSALSNVRRGGFDVAAYSRQFSGGPGNNNGSPNSGTLASGQPSNTQTIAGRDQTLARFKEQVIHKTSVDLSKSTIEERTADVMELKRQMEALRPYCQDDPEWPGITQLINDFEKRVALLPSGKLDPSVTADAADADDWTTGALSRGKMSAEVSFKKFKFCPPLDMRMDLRSSEDAPTGLVWNGTTSAAARLSIYTKPRNDPKQRKPVVSDKEAVLRVANDAGLLTVEAQNVTVSYGAINGIPFTRVAIHADAPGEHWIEYITPADDKWVIIHLALPPDNPQLAKIMDASARTIRAASPGEAKSDAFAAKFIAPRIADDYQRAAQLLRDLGPLAEDAVAEQLKNPDRTVRQHALELLQDIATEKSVGALRQAALDEDPANAALARMAIRRLGASTAPPAASQPTPPAPAVATGNVPPAPATPVPPRVAPSGPVDLGRVIADLDSNDPARKAEAVSKLPFIPVDPAKRPTVSAKLANLLRTKDASVATANLVEAMAVWADTTLCNDLMPLLEEKSDAEQRHAAMKVMGMTKDGRAAAAIVRWLKLDPVPTADALIAMGPVAESAVIPVLNDANATVRLDAARIIARIGTDKCLPELAKAARDQRDVAARQMAQAAISLVKARLATEPAKNP